LDVEAFNLAQGTAGSPILSESVLVMLFGKEPTYIGNELSNNGEDLACVNGHRWAEEGGISHAVGVEIASVSIAERRISRTNAAVGSRASCLLGD
jgi:hypothetical protein